MKRFFLFTLTLIASLNIWAESGTCGDNLTWKLENGVLTISGTGAMYDYSYSSYVPWSSSCSAISVAVIGEGVTSIGKFAFYNCSGLTSVTIPNSVTSIGWYAFDGCSGLTSITIPNSVTSIGEGAFRNCSSLTSVTIPNSVTSIERYTFYGCSGLTSVTIGNSVMSIGNYAFWYCGALTSITIPNSVKSIGYAPFDGCSCLPVIDNIRYADCVAVEAVDMYQSAYIIKEGTRFIHDGAFRRCSSLTSITIPNSVTSIGGASFQYCSGLTSITIPNSVTSVGEDAFSGCGALTSITIPSSVKSIGSHAYQNCSNVVEVFTGDGIETIPSECFRGCSALKKVVIGKSVREIGSSAFVGANRIEEIYAFPVVPPTCASSNVFDNYVYKAATVYVPNERNAIARYQADNVWKDFFDISSKDLSGIDTPTITPFTTDHTYYNLQGQRKVNTAKGLNIVNGKKVLMH